MFVDNDDGRAPADIEDKEGKSFRWSSMAASTPVHWPAEVTLNMEAPAKVASLSIVAVICRLCGLCDRWVECCP